MERTKVLGLVPPHFVHHSSLRFDVSTIWRLVCTDYKRGDMEWPFEALKTALYLDDQVRPAISTNTHDELACHSAEWQLLLKQVEWTADRGGHVSAISVWYSNTVDGMIEIYQSNLQRAPEDILSPIRDAFRRKRPYSGSKFYSTVGSPSKRKHFISIVHTDSICVIDVRDQPGEEHPPRGTRQAKTPSSGKSGNGNSMRGSGVGSARTL